jgi:glycosyltransferase involved in cell wall biosynthesis
MPRLMLLGLSPLPLDNQRSLTALNRRTWHFARALSEAGHDVMLACFRVHGAYAEAESLPPIFERQLAPNLLYRALEERTFMSGDTLDRFCEQFQPEAFVAIAPHTAQRAARLQTAAPLWADLYGYLMGEAQAAAYVHHDDTHLAAWHRERATLERADVFSTCSLRQRYAVIGELGAVGRLNQASAGYDFVRVLPSAVEPEPYEHTRTVLRGTLVAPDDFVVLFAGGYNTWTDVDTLFDGLSRAMRRNRHVKFVSTGGAIKGHDERTFARFRELIAGSPFADRFIFTGWLAVSEVSNYYLESDVGINVDKFNYETLLGTRYRITDMCKAGLPVLTTLGTELSHEIRRERLGLTFPIADANGMAEAILRLASDRALRDDMAARAARHARQNWALAKALEPLLAWANAPAHAPDYGRPLPAAIINPAALLAPRSRLAQLAVLIEQEGYLRAFGRAARAVPRRAARLAARAVFERRALALSEVAAAHFRRVLVIPAGDPALVPAALERVRDVMPDAEILVAGAGDLGALLGADDRIRAVDVGASGGRILGLRAEARQLRALDSQATVVVGLAGRRAEVLARLIGGRVLLLSDDGNWYESALDPLKTLRRLGGRLAKAAGVIGYAGLVGVVAVGIALTDAIGAVSRFMQRGAGGMGR